MIEANTVLATQRLQDQLPELGYSLVGSGQYLDPTTSLWTLMAAQVGPSDAVLDALIADDVALGSAPRGVTEYELRNPYPPCAGGPSGPQLITSAFGGTRTLARVLKSQ